MADASGNHGEPADEPFLARKAQAELAGQVGDDHRRAVEVPIETVEAADIQRLTGAHARRMPSPLAEEGVATRLPQSRFRLNFL
jgi:hypothetical protein